MKPLRMEFFHRKWNYFGIFEPKAELLRPRRKRFLKIVLKNAPPMERFGKK
jgi:hypothetical protein